MPATLPPARRAAPCVLRPVLPQPDISTATCSRLAPTDAHGGDAASKATAAQRIDERDDHPAPEAPIGWPSAQAPPWTFTFSASRPSSRIAAIGTTAKGLVDFEEIDSPMSQPMRRQSALIAPIGAVGKRLGASAWVE